MAEEQLIRGVLVFAILIGALYLISKYTPTFVKRHFWRPVANLLWHTPRQRKGLLWTLWFVYCLAASTALLSLFFADQLTGRDVFIVFLLSIPATLGKKFMDYWSKRRKQRYQLPARRRSARNRSSRRHRLPGRP